MTLGWVSRAGHREDLLLTLGSGSSCNWGPGLALNLGCWGLALCCPPVSSAVQ